MLLRVKLNKTLNWNDQIDKICISLGYVNSILFRLKMQSVPSDILLIVYKALFLPYINYACCVWGLTTKANLQKLQRLQNSAIRVIYGFPKRDHVTPYRIKHQLLSVKQIIHRFICNFIHKQLTCGSDDSYFIPYFFYSNFSQNRKKLFLPCASLQVRQRTLFFRGIQFYNNLPQKLRELSFAEFKKEMKTFSLTWDESNIVI